MGNNRDNFVRLAENRTEKALKTIKLIGNLSNSTNYSYTNDDIDKIFTALNKELRDTKAKFTSNNGQNGSSVFKLND